MITLPAIMRMRKLGRKALFNSCLAFVAGLCFASHAFAISESDYEAQMNAKVRPYYSTGVEGSFQSKGGITIRYGKWEVPAEKGAIVLLPGRADAYATFDETIYDLAQQGYSVYAMDERGQGASERLLANPQLGYVRHFEDYVFDLKIFVDTVVNAHAHAKTFLLSHSMGGAIAALYVNQFPSDFTGAVLVSPMLRINTSPFAYWEARLIDWLELAIGHGKDYAPTQQGYDPQETFEGNKLTTSEVRWRNMREILNTHPSLQLGGATGHWIKEAMKADDRIHSHAARIETPILMLTAGDDQVVDIPEQRYFCGLAKRCTQVVPYADARHSILLERDSIRNDALTQISTFFSEL